MCFFVSAVGGRISCEFRAAGSAILPPRSSDSFLPRQPKTSFPFPNNLTSLPSGGYTFPYVIHKSTYDLWEISVGNVWIITQSSCTTVWCVHGKSWPVYETPLKIHSTPTFTDRGKTLKPNVCRTHMNNHHKNDKTIGFHMPVKMRPSR